MDIVMADGGAYLAGHGDGSVDLLFFDAERVEYRRWWPHSARVLGPGGVLAVDTALFHRDEVAEFLALVDAGGRFVATTATVGKGLCLPGAAGDRASPHLYPLWTQWLCATCARMAR